MIIVTEEINSGTSGARSPGSGRGSLGTPEVAAAAVEGAVTATIVAEVMQTSEEQEPNVELAMDSNGDGDGSESLLSQSPGKYEWKFVKR